MGLQGSSSRGLASPSLDGSECEVTCIKAVNVSLLLTTSSACFYDYSRQTICLGYTSPFPLGRLCEPADQDHSGFATSFSNCIPLLLAKRCHRAFAILESYCPCHCHWLLGILVLWKHLPLQRWLTGDPSFSKSTSDCFIEGSAHPAFPGNTVPRWVLCSPIINSFQKDCLPDSFLNILSRSFCQPYFISLGFHCI